MSILKVRSALIDTMSGLLEGPLSTGEVLESAPVDTYLTGVLWPRGTSFSEADDIDGGDPESGNSDAVETGVPGYRVNRPCSIGLTFAVDAGLRLSVSLGSSARYLRTATAAQGVPEASDIGAYPRYRWTHRLLGYHFVIDAGLTAAVWTVNEFSGPDGGAVRDERVSVHVRRRAAGAQVVYTLTLINDAADASFRADGDDPCMFQSGLIVTVLDPELGGIGPRPKQPVRAGDQDALTNALLYRDVHEFATGHGIAAMWGPATGAMVHMVRTAWLPHVEVRGTSAQGSHLLEPVLGQHPHLLTAAFLADETGRAATVRALQAFSDCYGSWIEDTLRSRVAGFERAELSAATFNLARCAETHGRINAGIDMLRTDNRAFAAFALANRAMDRQSMFPAKGRRAGPLTWRPFQLAFILLVVPGLVDPACDDRECMDLLWFPTGGGKTEAYLALTAFQIFYQRLASAERCDEGGVDVIMRYTLRLLTVQQFQRAAALIIACDLMRANDDRLGNARISLGLYVGGDATPNKMAAARIALDDERAGNNPASTPRQLLRCPVCGTDLLAEHYHAHERSAQIDIVCGNVSCECAGVPLPVLTVDEAILAMPPSLLIGTVDKFAQLPRNDALGRLFGIGTGLRPSLIIQDELHLISGPLGSMAGLYETVVDLLCSNAGVRAKIIGSTATIGQAARQVRALFDRSVLQFPPPGFDATDSFFAVRDNGDDRTYIGLPSAGRSPKFALQALMAALLQGAEALRSGGVASDVDIDPYWTCVAYFNSLRELGGALVLMQDDVPRQMRFLASRLAVPLRALDMQPEELSSRVQSRDLPKVLQSLEVRVEDGPFDEPKDTVLASNMISVGVDVPRLGLMVVNGQPKSTAEYIQASSRIGRGMPGLVVTLYNVGRPRDLSHFEHFCSYHGALYRNVEASSVTPWAPRARDKALHAVIIAAIRHLVPGMAEDGAALQFDPAAPGVGAIVDAIAARAAAVATGIDGAEAQQQIADVIATWARRAAAARDSANPLNYWERKAPYGKTAPHLMNSAEDAPLALTQAWPTPNSMREVEPSTAFILKRIAIKGVG